MAAAKICDGYLAYDLSLLGSKAGRNSLLRREPLAGSKTDWRGVVVREMSIGAGNLKEASHGVKILGFSHNTAADMASRFANVSFSWTSSHHALLAGH